MYERVATKYALSRVGRVALKGCNMLVVLFGSLQGTPTGQHSPTKKPRSAGLF